MNRIILFLIIYFVTNFLTGNHIVYANTLYSALYGFHIEIPDEWSKMKPNYPWTLFNYAKLGSGENMNINIKSAQGISSIKQFPLEQAFNPYYEDVKFIEKNYEIVSGIDVFKCIYKWKDSFYKKVERKYRLQYFGAQWIKDDKLFTVIITDLEEKFSKNTKTYRKIVDSIKFTLADADRISKENADADADRIFKENSKAVVMVTTYDEKGNVIKHGSGFIVRRDGVVVTNYHVIGMAKDIKVKAGNKVLDVEGLIFTDKINDLAILKAKAKNMPVVKLGVIEKANIGEHVYVIGYPLGFEKKISVGLLNGIRKIDEKREILKMVALISPGSSGSPVFNRNGEVIGVVTSSPISETRNSSFAISVKLIKDKISSKRVIAIKESGLEDYINTAIYWNQLGVAYGDSGMYKEAIEAYKQAIKIDPDDAEAHFNLGVTYGDSGMYKEAIEAYKQAIRIDPNLAEAHLGLGLTYNNSGMYKEAIEAYKQAIRIDPDYADAHNNLGVTYYESGKYKEAIEAFKQAIRIDPDFAWAHYNLGLTYNNSGMHKEAIDAYKQAIRIDPDFVRAHLNLGLSYISLNDRGSALEQYEILKSLDTEMAKVLLDYIDKHTQP